ncbi:hypothetical protein P775_25895 [Puniceibacterium antarcticum]|uniref:Uncharacterized protein n=1 Tax=Puniceibacterium antarcticum TaxID=1206336 RepID=A0A2G8R250_9RHOB|nr:hypothetical protein P775_25895 [Puniceibacterium antarcticum]
MIKADTESWTPQPQRSVRRRSTACRFMPSSMRTNPDFGYESAITVLFTLRLMLIVVFYVRRIGKAVS